MQRGATPRLVPRSSSLALTHRTISPSVGFQVMAYESSYYEIAVFDTTNGPVRCAEGCGWTELGDGQCQVRWRFLAGTSFGWQRELACGRCPMSAPLDPLCSTADPVPYRFGLHFSLDATRPRATTTEATASQAVGVDATSTARPLGSMMAIATRHAFLLRADGMAKIAEDPVVPMVAERSALAARQTFTCCSACTAQVDADDVHIFNTMINCPTVGMALTTCPCWSGQSAMEEETPLPAG